MRITQIVERPVPLLGDVSNSVVDFSRHDASLLAVFTDRVRDGEPVVGVAFNSIGRFAQSGILRDRMIPRVLAADPEKLLDADGDLDPARVLAECMVDEKPGGHGDRAAAASVIELACWDAISKAAGEPAYQQIARKFGCSVTSPSVSVYAAGGYYHPQAGLKGLKRELAGYAEMGYDSFKVKIGGAALAHDLARVEIAIDIAGDASRVAVDANGRFPPAEARQVAGRLREYGLRWLEEPGDPLDYTLNKEVIREFGGPIATGENLFSRQDVVNLVLFGGMRPRQDYFQMDAGLSYGLTEYVEMIRAIEGLGFDRKWLYPHGGHLINLHIVFGLGLGGCEAYPGVFQPFGGYHEDVLVAPGRMRPPEAPGFGLEEKPDLYKEIRRLIE